MSVVQQLFERQRNDRNNFRKNFSLLRKLILQESAKFKKVWQIQSKSQIMYEEKRIFLDNYRTCYACHGSNGKPSLLYKKPIIREMKNKDALLCSINVGNLDPSMIKFKGHQPNLLTLTSNNMLQRINLDTGDVLQSVYLSRKYKFKYLSWVEIMETVLVKSTSIQDAGGRQDSSLVALAVFTVYPLELLCMVEINKEIFGNDVFDVIMSHSMLIAYHRKGRIRLYSFPQILQQFITKNIKLGDRYEGHDDNIVGDHPLGIPCNLHIKECPDVLFEVDNCEEHCITIGGFPWHYIINHKPSCGSMMVFNLENKKKVKNGKLKLAYGPAYGGDNAWFHWDESGRLIHTGPHKMRMLKIKQYSDHSELIEIFNINTSEDDRQTPSSLMATSSGRIIKQREFGSSIAWPMLHESLKGVEHENELDLLTVVSTVTTAEGQRGCVSYHDNYTGEKYKVVQLDGIWEEHLDYEVSADLDTVCCIVKNGGIYHCDFYKLSRDIDNWSSC